MAESTIAATPTFGFTYDTCASPFTANLQAYLDAHSDSGFHYIATGAIVFDNTDSAIPSVLLIQRAASDSMPNLWEIPGGGCDFEDESILYAVARELWEEAGLKATHIGAPVGDPHLFVSRSGKQICKLNFVVQAERNVEGRFEAKLSPEEHQQFLWASQKEVRDERVGDVQLNFAAKELKSTVLLAFDQLKE